MKKIMLALALGVTLAANAATVDVTPAEFNWTTVTNDQLQAVFNQYVVSGIQNATKAITSSVESGAVIDYQTNNTNPCSIATVTSNGEAILKVSFGNGFGKFCFANLNAKSIGATDAITVSGKVAFTHSSGTAFTNDVNIEYIKGSQAVARDTQVIKIINSNDVIDGSKDEPTESDWKEFSYTGKGVQGFYIYNNQMGNNKVTLWVKDIKLEKTEEEPGEKSWIGDFSEKEVGSCDDYWDVCKSSLETPHAASIPDVKELLAANTYSNGFSYIYCNQNWALTDYHTAIAQEEVNDETFKYLKFGDTGKTTGFGGVIFAPADFYNFAAGSKIRCTIIFRFANGVNASYSSSQGISMTVASDSDSKAWDSFITLEAPAKAEGASIKAITNPSMTDEAKDNWYKATMTLDDMKLAQINFGRVLYGNEVHIGKVSFDTVSDASDVKVVSQGTAQELGLVSTPTSIGSVAAPEALEAAPVYYDMQGRRVINPSAGLYVVVRGSKVSKEFVR